MTTPVLMIAPQYTFFPTPRKTVTSNAYYLALASLPNHYGAALSNPSNTIEIFDKSTLERMATLVGHENGAVTALKVAENMNGFGSKHFVSSGKDGSVKIWDDRTGSHAIKMTNLGKTRPFLSCDVSFDGLTVASGTELQGEDALLMYWDPRQPAVPLRVHESTHSDDITTLSFASASIPGMKVILSGSSDGLVTTSNAEEEDGDNAILNVGNWGCSVSQAGWIRNSTGARIWVSSDMETFSTWTDELEILQDFDIRTPSVHGYGKTWVTDYLINCKTTISVPSNLGVFVGSNEGDIGLVTCQNLDDVDAPWRLEKLWTCGHVGVIRSVLWDEEARILVTGGEDGKINFWPTETCESTIAASPRKRRGGYSDDEDGDEKEDKKARRS